MPAPCRPSTAYTRPATDEAAGTGRYGRGEPGGQHRRWPHLVGAPRAGSGWEPSEPSQVTITAEHDHGSPPSVRAERVSNSNRTLSFRRVAKDRCSSLMTRQP